MQIHKNIQQIGTTEARRYDTERNKSEEKTERYREQKPASEILKLTELHKQMLLLGNYGRLLEKRKASVIRERRAKTNKTFEKCHENTARGKDLLKITSELE